MLQVENIKIKFPEVIIGIKSNSSQFINRLSLWLGNSCLVDDEAEEMIEVFFESNGIVEMKMTDYSEKYEVKNFNIYDYAIFKIMGFWERVFSKKYKDKYLLIHGGAVAKDGKSIIVLGNSNAGKSTLITAFLEKGNNFLSDDVLLLNPENRVITTLKKNLHLSEKSLEFFPNLKSKFRGEETFDFPDMKNIYLDPSNYFPIRTLEEISLQNIKLIIKCSIGQDSKITNMDKVGVIWELVTSTYSFHKKGEGNKVINLYETILGNSITVHFQMGYDFKLKLDKLIKDIS